MGIGKETPCYYSYTEPEQCSEHPLCDFLCQIIENGGCWKECSDGQKSQHHKAKLAKAREIREEIEEYLHKEQGGYIYPHVLRCKKDRIAITNIIKKYL